MNNTTEQYPPLLKQEDVARILGISVRTARSWLNKGKLPEPIIKINNRPRWCPIAFTSWLKGEKNHTNNGTQE